MIGAAIGPIQLFVRGVVDYVQLAKPPDNTSVVVIANIDSACSALREVARHLDDGVHALDRVSGVALSAGCIVQDLRGLLEIPLEELPLLVLNLMLG